MPQQQTTTSVPVNSPPASPSSIQQLDARLATHTIEPELRIGPPRDFQRIEFRGSLMPQYVDARKAHLLRMGRAIPALITQIEVLPGEKGIRVVFNYATSSNPQTIDHVTLPLDRAAELGLQRGETFTLLVDPEDDHDVLPYFLIRTPSRPFALSLFRLRRARAKAAPPSARIAAAPGVEPELYCATPRHVAWTPGTARARIWAANVAALIVFATYYLWQPGQSNGMLLLGAAYPLAITLSIWGVLESRWRKSRFYLEHGSAVPATVRNLTMRQGDNGMITEVACEYPHPGGTSLSHSMSLSAAQVQSIGGLALGSKFTLLCHPKWNEAPMPYFSIRGAEIPGAKPAQTTPPSIP